MLKRILDTETNTQTDGRTDRARNLVSGLLLAGLEETVESKKKCVIVTSTEWWGAEKTNTVIKTDSIWLAIHSADESLDNVMSVKIGEYKYLQAHNTLQRVVDC